MAVASRPSSNWRYIPPRSSKRAVKSWKEQSNNAYKILFIIQIQDFWLRLKKQGQSTTWWHLLHIPQFPPIFLQVLLVGTGEKLFAELRWYCPNRKYNFLLLFAKENCIFFMQSVNTHAMTLSSLLIRAVRAPTTSWEARGSPRELSALTARWIWVMVESSLTAARRISRVSLDTGI